jgi:surface antigen
MIELLIGTYVPQIELLQTITKEPPAIVKVVEPTLQEKIASNYYKCDESLFWIRADNAQCLAKPVVTVQAVSKTTKAQKPVEQAVQGSQGLNGYEPGQCTAFVASKRYVPSGWGDATNWRYNAINAGWTVSDVPVAGAIAWRSGHVAYVESVGDGTVTITEQNYDWNSGIRTITIPVDSYQYIY